MSLLQPWFLWALLSLSVPLAIHLLSRKEGKLIRMGSLRHIRETSSRQFRSIRLNELLLLALRSIVIGLIALLMGGWVLNSLEDDRKWLILEPGVESKPKIVSLRDSLRASGYEERYLVNGFPELDGSVVGAKDLKYLTRIEELSALSVDSVVVVATNRSVGFNGPRISLPSNVRWLVVEPEPTEFVVNRTVIRSDSVFLRAGKSTADATTFSTYKMPSVKDSSGTRTTKVQPEIMKITVASDEGFEADKRILLATLEVIRTEVPEILQVSSVVASSVQLNLATDWLFWLSEDAPPPIDGRIVRYQPRPDLPLLSRNGQKEYFLTGRINSEVWINQNSATKLMRMLFPGESEWRLAKALDVRRVDDRALWSKAQIVGGASVAPTGNQASTRYLLVVLFFFVVLERIISYKRSQ